jgi:uncharacterized protein
VAKAEPQGAPVAVAGAPLATRELPALLERVHASLEARRQVIDDLNVFPVPDGDTGTNMTLTVRAGLDALREEAPRSGRAASKVVTRGVLRGARGNSGVILSQVLRAVVEVVTGHREVDAALYAQALDRARDLAYEAVAEPVEGTILTAIAAAADAANEGVAAGHDLVGTSALICSRVAAAVEETTDQLAVLRDAGVVDAGARGFEVLVAAVHGHLTGQEPPVREDLPPPGVRGSQGGCLADLAFPFEVQYLLDARDRVAPLLRHELEGIGDSVVVVAAGNLLNVHVHTDDVGAAVEAGLEYGRPSRIEVVHFGDQIAGRTRSGHGLRAPVPELPALGTVAVLDGTGVSVLARSLGAIVVRGTAGALPSVADLLDAIASSEAPDVLVLPGHRNAVPTALQAAQLAAAEGDERVRVIEEATTPPAVLAALAVVDATAPAEQVLADARAAAAQVRAGAVVAASRDAETPVGPVRRGQPLVVVDGEVRTVHEEPLEALVALGTALEVADAEVVALHLGGDVDAAEATAAVERLEGLTDAEVEVLEAGQRPVRYWVGAE